MMEKKRFHVQFMRVLTLKFVPLIDSFFQETVVAKLPWEKLLAAN